MNIMMVMDEGHLLEPLLFLRVSSRARSPPEGQLYPIWMEYVPEAPPCQILLFLSLGVSACRLLVLPRSFAVFTGNFVDQFWRRMRQ